MTIGLRFSALALVAVLGGSCGRGARPDLPNVLLVTLDTSRRDRFGVYGGDVPTPSFDMLAARGVLCERAVTVAPLTWPSHSTMFTGDYPIRHGVHMNGSDILDASRLTMAEILQSEGYTTAAFVGASVLDRRLGAGQGFDYYGDVHGERDLLAGRPQSDTRTWWERSAKDVTAEALRVLRRAREPFFAWIHFFDPHSPYRPPPPFDTRYKKRPYDGEIAAMDVHLGELVRGVDALARRREVVIIVIADHGECLGERDGYYGHAMELSEEVLQIPALFVYEKKLPAGTRFHSLYRTVDLLPTLLDLLDIQPPRTFTGVSRVDDLQRGYGGPEDCLHENCYVELQRVSNRIFAFRDGPWKVRWSESDTGPRFSRTEWDGCAERATNEPPELAVEMAARARYYRDTCLEELPAGDAYPSAERIESMRALGYLY